MTDPVDVTTDSHGNVYEADNYGGTVNEYAQGSNTVLHTCAISGAKPASAAADAAGDVFVAYNNSNRTANINEYHNGLSGCNPTKLGVTLNVAGGMVLDNKSDIIICDQLGPTVDVIKPPYSTVTSFLGSGYADPRFVRINKKNNQVYAADFSNADVQVLSYPGGTLQAVITSGLSEPTSAVGQSNFVP